ncbi:hypothetical protein Pelo_15450 [Pelomyxa schiedti]|nr:hypothetical protein Pelo_15450 [Pelomyxa schiedti]
MGQTVGTNSHPSHESHDAHYLATQASILAVVRKRNKLLTAAAKAQTARLAKLAAATAPGREADAAWCTTTIRDENDPRIPSDVSKFVRHMVSRKLPVRISLPFVCAALGHLDELVCVLDAWAARPGAESRAAVQALVDGPCTFDFWAGATPLAVAARERHRAVARCLAEKYRADPRPRFEFGNAVTEVSTALNMSLYRGQPEVTEAILAACGADDAARISLLRGEGCGLRPLNIALHHQDSPDEIEQVRVLTDSAKWGAAAMAALDKDWPIAEYCKQEEARPEILRHLCSVFSGGLGLALLNATSTRFRHFERAEAQQILVDHPAFLPWVNEESYPGKNKTPLLLATIIKNQPVALKLLSLGANPNAPCEYDMGNYDSQAKTPMILAVIFNQKELVDAMAKRGGLLPSKSDFFWKRFPDKEYPHIAGYLDLYQSQTVKVLSVEKYSALESIDKLRGSMPVMDFSGVPPSDPESGMVSAAKIEMDDTITSLLAQYQAETAEVLGYLDIQSLGRIQQTSRFWYHVGRSNSSWQHAFMNSSAAWPHSTRVLLRRYLHILKAEEEVKWKHVCFFWASRNLCQHCVKPFRVCDGTDCTDRMGYEGHRPVLVPPSLHRYHSILDEAREKVRRSAFHITISFKTHSKEEPSHKE